MRRGVPVARPSGLRVPGENYGDASLRLGTDKDGRFHVRGLIPGRKYTIIGLGNMKFGRVLIDVTVEAGQTKDVGEVTLQPPDMSLRLPNPTTQPKKRSDPPPSAPGATR